MKLVEYQSLKGDWTILSIWNACSAKFTHEFVPGHQEYISEDITPSNLLMWSHIRNGKPLPAINAQRKEVTVRRKISSNN